MGRYWFNKGMAFLPIFTVTWTYLTFATSYMIAVFRGDVDADLPYISDTGARRPESSVFGIMLNISACVALSCMYVRFKQINEYLEKVHESKYKLVKFCNKLAIFLGFFVCFGLSLVANFQETSVLTVHVIGAMMTFVLGAIYELLDAFITLKMHPEINGKTIFYVRLFIATLSVCILIGEFIASSINSEAGIAHIKFHWNPNDPGFYSHLATTILEWCLAASFLAYFFTFIRDFQQISLNATPRLHQASLHHDLIHNEYIDDETEEDAPRSYDGRKF